MLLTEWDNEEAVAVSREEGREEGRAEGMEAGMEGKAAETAIKMLKDGFNADKIAQYVDMPVEWVEGLLAEV